MEAQKLMKRFLRHVKTHKKVSRGTLKNYEGVLREFIKYPLSEEGLERYLESIEEQAPSTQARKIVIVKNFLEYLYDKGIIKRRYWDDIRPPRAKHLPRWLTPKEAEKAISLAREPYNYIFEFLYRTGMRIGELENLREQDISPDGEEYIVKIKGKGNKERVLRVSRQIIQLLYKAGFPSALPSRRLIQKEARRVGKILGRKVTPHVFRHSFAIRMLASGKPITLVQALLGHSKLDTTAVYTQISSDAITLR